MLRSLAAARALKSLRATLTNSNRNHTTIIIDVQKVIAACPVADFSENADLSPGTRELLARSHTRPLNPDHETLTQLILQTVACTKIRVVKAPGRCIHNELASNTRCTSDR